MRILKRTFCTQSPYLKYFKFDGLIKGCATLQHTTMFSKRNPLHHAQNWSLLPKIPILLSSLGLGTQRDDTSLSRDILLFQAMKQSIESGSMNVVDCCASFRNGRSQKLINALLQYLAHQTKISRNELFLISKCGIVPIDSESGFDETHFIKIMIEQLLIPAQEIVEDSHCMHPKFLQFSIEKSRHCMGVQTIDLMLISCFADIQKQKIKEHQFETRLSNAVTLLEAMRKENKIKYYGICEINGFRMPPDQPGHLNLQKVVNIVQKTVGKDNGFKFIMFPFNLGAPQSLLKWQGYKQENQQRKEGQLSNKQQIEYVDIFQAAKRLQINVVTTSPLMQGNIASLPFANKKLQYLQHNSSKHLQMIRSYKPQSHQSTIIEHSTKKHVEANLEVTKHPRLTDEEWKEILPV